MLTLKGEESVLLGLIIEHLESFEKKEWEFLFFAENKLSVLLLMYSNTG